MRDIVLKLGHQSQCYRVVQYHSLRHDLHMIAADGFGDTVCFLLPTHSSANSDLVLVFMVWPTPFPWMICKHTQAVELGPHTNKSGPGLVLLRGVTANLDALLSWLETPHMRG